MNESKTKLMLDYRIITAILLVIIAAMLFLWRPWQSTNESDRTIDVTGQATVSARPDSFTFYPAYEFKNADKQAALSQLTAKSDDVVAKIKSLGVEDKDIKTNSDAWSFPSIPVEGESQTPTYTLRLTVTVDSEELAQKIQDYLVTTAPTGTISPQATFSDKQRKELEDKGRDEAAKDARAKADQSAENLGFKIKGVKSVKDDVGFGGVYPLNQEVATDASRSAFAIQPGENDLSYTVTVTYFIK